jgi:integrase
MGYSITPLINRSKRKSKSGLHKIQIRVTIDRKSIYISIDYRVSEMGWSGKDGSWVKENYPHAYVINRSIRDKLSSLYEIIDTIKRSNRALTLEAIKKFAERRGDQKCFNDYINTFMIEHQFNELNTVKKYRAFKNHVDEYDSNILFSSLNETLFQDFAQFLLRKGLIGVTVVKYFDPFKKICKQAVKDGYLDRDPFYLVDLGVKPTKSKRVYLELEEIQLFKRAKMPSDRADLIHTQNHWLFCFYAAFYYSDLRELTWDKIRASDQGYLIIGNRFKNDETFISPIHKFSHAIEIIENQRKETEGRPGDLVFPNIISEQKFNAKLKEVAKIVGIQKNLTNKMARHSAVQFWEAQGLETQHTAKIVGHTNERTTKNYYDLSIRDINSRVGKFDFKELGL